MVINDDGEGDSHNEQSKNNNRSQYLLQVLFALGNVIGTLYILSHWILKKTQRINYYSQAFFTDIKQFWEIR